VNSFWIGLSFKDRIMSNKLDPEVIGEGKHLRLVRRDGWEYVERTSPIRAVFIAAITDEGELILIVEQRVPVNAGVVGFPAGLVGDIDGEEGESYEEATRRELVEEAGYHPESVQFLTKGPTSAGITDEVIAIMLATGLRQVGAGGGIGRESIAVHKVPLVEADAWLKARVAEGTLVDPKVYTGLYFIERLEK
jgi:ADP-ribose pyrophosphatase